MSSFDLMLKEQIRIQQEIQAARGMNKSAELMALKHAQENMERTARAYRTLNEPYVRQLQALQKAAAPFAEYAKLLSFEIEPIRKQWESIERLRNSIDRLSGIDSATREILALADAMKKLNAPAEFEKILNAETIARINSSLDEVESQVADIENEAAENETGSTKFDQIKNYLTVLLLVVSLMDKSLSVYDKICAPSGFADLCARTSTLVANVTLLPQREAEKTYVVTTDVALRTAPNIASDRTLTATAGRVFVVSSEHEGWHGGFYITGEGKHVAGWIKSDYLVAAPHLAETTNDLLSAP